MDSRNGSLGLAIVAVPNEDDSVYRVSSQPVPHMTILFLGDQSAEETQTIVEFVEHAAKQLGPFGMVKDYRGLLGSNDADVIFFEDNPVIERFRAMLLQNDTIKIAYESTDQFPSFNPHITLGYPDNPAIVDDDRNYYLGYTQFDRIAVWVDDYSGPEFRLKFDDTLDELSMSDGPTEDSVDISDFMDSVLEHHGVKGMRWGVRKDDKTGIRMVSPKRRTATLLGDMGNEVGSASKLMGLTNLAASSYIANSVVVKALESTNLAVSNALLSGSLTGPAAYGALGGLAVGGNLAVIGGIQTMRAIFRPVSVMYGGAKKDIRKGVKALNEEFAGKTSTKDQDDYNNRYAEVVGRAFLKKKSVLAHPFVNLAERSFGINRSGLGTAIKAHVKQNDKGKMILTITGPSGDPVKLNLGKIKHADESDEIDYAEFEFLFQYGEDGRINDWYSPQLDFMDKIARSNDGDTVVHESEDLSDFLEHAGIKGMRWGVRRKLDKDGLIVKSDEGKPTDQVEKKAGSEDTEVAAKSAAKLTEDGGGAGTLSNKEMTDLMNRIRNERTLAALINEDRRSDTQKQIDSMKEKMELDSLNAAQKEANRSVGSKLAGKLLESGTEMLTDIAKEKISDYGDSVLESMGFSKPKSLKDQADEAKHRFEIASYGDKISNLGGSKKKNSDDSGGSENSPKKSKVKSALDSVKDELGKPAISEESARLARETKIERDIDKTTKKVIGSLKTNSVDDSKAANERAKRLLDTTNDINDWMDVQNSKLTRKFGHDDDDESQPSITHEDLRDLVKMIARG